MKTLALWGAAAAALSFAIAAQAAEFPTKPITLVVPFAPGGPTDAMARTLAAAVKIGQPVIVENRAGAGGNLGAEAVARAAADGHTVLFGTSGPLAINVSLYKKIGYDPVKSFAPVIQIGHLPNVLVVNPSIPAKTVKELVAYAKANPGKLNFSSSGMGTSSHLGGEFFKSLAGISIQHIAYKGTGPSLQDLQSGQVQMAVDSLATLLPFIKSGRLVALGISNTQRNPLLPDAPPIAEELPGYLASTINYFTVRSGTPKAIVDRLNRDISAVLRQPEVRDRMLGMAVTPVIETPEVLAARITREQEKWRRVIQQSGAKVE
jgi:tripartite-type tricarboxylate transporter receptor subunit TctC